MLLKPPLRTSTWGYRGKGREGLGGRQGWKGNSPPLSRLNMAEGKKSLQSFKKGKRRGCQGREDKGKGKSLLQSSLESAGQVTFRGCNAGLRRGIQFISMNFQGSENAASFSDKTLRLPRKKRIQVHLKKRGKTIKKGQMYCRFEWRVRILKRRRRKFAGVRGGYGRGKRRKAHIIQY